MDDLLFHSLNKMQCFGAAVFIHGQNVAYTVHLLLLNIFTANPSLLFDHQHCQP